MKRFAISLIIGLALVSTGCEEEAADVDTVPPVEDPAVSGYRGVEDQVDEPTRLDEPTGVVVDPELEPDPNATETPTLGETDGQQDPFGAAEETDQPEQTGVEDEPAVEEVPAESLPADAETDEE